MVLVLLIIFMVATPILQMGLDVEVPPKVTQTEPRSETDRPQIVVIVRSDGVYLNDQKMATTAELRDVIAREMSARPTTERVVFVNSEDALIFDRAVQVMDTAQEAGAEKVGFLTDPPRE